MGKVLFILLRLLAVPWIGTVAGLLILYQLAICKLALPDFQSLAVFCVAPMALFSTAIVCQLGNVVAARWASLVLVEVTAFGLALGRANLGSPWRLGRKPSLFHPPGTTALAPDGTNL